MSVRKDEIKVKENIDVNKPKFNEKIQVNLAQTLLSSMKEQIMP
jgi:hypothetical protein